MLREAKHLLRRFSLPSRPLAFRPHKPLSNLPGVMTSMCHVELTPLFSSERSDHGMIQYFCSCSELRLEIAQAGPQELKFRKYRLQHFIDRHPLRRSALRSFESPGHVTQIADQERPDPMFDCCRRYQWRALFQAFSNPSIRPPICPVKVLEDLCRVPLPLRTAFQVSGVGSGYCIFEFTLQTREIGIHRRVQ